MNDDKPKTPGAMVQITHEQLRDLVAGYCGPSALGDLYALADAPAEQTPAVGGSIAERIRAATIADSGQEGVNIAEGRFGKAMAALCLQLDGETPAVGACSHRFMSMADDPRRCADCNEPESAVGWEPEVFLMVRNRELNSTWRLADKAAFDCAGTLPKYERMELIDRAHAAPLLAEIERLKSLSVTNIMVDAARSKDWERIEGLEDTRDQFKARIADIEAQQGEPVAVIDEGDDGLFAEFIYGEDGSPLRRGDKLYLNPADKGYVSKLAYQSMQAEVERLSAQPVTVKVLLPERKDARSMGQSIMESWRRGWNACLDEIARLNP